MEEISICMPQAEHFIVGIKLDSLGRADMMGSSFLSGSRLPSVWFRHLLCCAVVTVPSEFADCSRVVEYIRGRDQTGLSV
jgi:hypothetical protein